MRIPRAICSTPAQPGGWKRSGSAGLLRRSPAGWPRYRAPAAARCPPPRLQMRRTQGSEPESFCEVRSRRITDKESRRHQWLVSWQDGKQLSAEPVGTRPCEAAAPAAAAAAALSSSVSSSAAAPAAPSSPVSASEPSSPCGCECKAAGRHCDLWPGRQQLSKSDSRPACTLIGSRNPLSSSVQLCGQANGCQRRAGYCAESRCRWGESSSRWRRGQ